MRNPRDRAIEIVIVLAALAALYLWGNDWYARLEIGALAGIALLIHLSILSTRASRAYRKRRGRRREH